MLLGIDLLYGPRACVSLISSNPCICVGLLYGPRGVRLLMSEATLYRVYSKFCSSSGPWV
jgi:hypothetical protein